jgi:hypothetical protein
MSLPVILVASAGEAAVWISGLFLEVSCEIPGFGLSAATLAAVHRWTAAEFLLERRVALQFPDLEAPGRARRGGRGSCDFGVNVFVELLSK